MKVLLKEPGKAPRSLVIDGSLRTMQGIVGGNIEPVRFSSTSTILCNEEGKLLGLKPNFEIIGDLIVGPVLFVGVDGEKFCDLSVEDATQAVNMLRYNSI